MGSLVFGAVALLAAGFAFGWFRSRKPRPATGTRWTGRVLLAIVCFPIGLLLLAQLFDSNALGWMFGLTLMAGAALVPCGVVFLMGYLLASMFRPTADAEEP